MDGRWSVCWTAASVGWSRKEQPVFWSKPAPPPPPPPPPPAPPPAAPPKKTRRWGLYLILGVIGLSVASAGCKDRRDPVTGKVTTSVKAGSKTGSSTGVTIGTVAQTIAVLPTATTQPDVQLAEYVIASGDTLFGVARKFGVSVSAILAANNMTEAAATRIQVGHRILIPVAAGAATPPAAAPVTAKSGGGAGTFPPVTVADNSPQTSIVTVTVIVNVPRTTVKA